MVEAEAPRAVESKTKSLFKKKKGFKKIKASTGRIRDRSADDSDEEVHGTETEKTSAMETIISVKKKRKLIESVLGKDRRGLDASLLLKAKVNKSETPAEVETPDAPTDMTDHLRGTFSGGTGGSGADGSGDGVIQKKHKAAMEEFIHKNLESKTSEEQAQKSDGEAVSKAANAKDMETQLYEELASSANKLSGIGQVDTGAGVSSAQEGDVGAGGAMLGGTGIAEVALPLEERLKTVRETEAAARAREQMRLHRQDAKPIVQQAPKQLHLTEDQMLPMNFSAGAGKRRNKESVGRSDKRAAGLVAGGVTGTSARMNPPTASSAGIDVLRSDVEGVGSSYSHNFRLHTTEWATKKNEERDAELELERKKHEKEEEPAASQGRLGFDAARRAAKGELPLPSSGVSNSNSERDGKFYQQRSSDDRVWKSFVQREKKR